MRISVVVMVTLSYVTVLRADVQPQKDFNLQRFAGRWFRVGLAYDSAAFAPYRDRMRISMGMITPQANGNVNLTMWDLTPAGCASKLYRYERTNKAGQFTYLSTRHSMMKDITVVETNYTEYALVLKHKKFDREYTQVALYGRSRSLRPEIIQKFRDFARSRGFPPESVLTPPHGAENCPPIGSGR